MSQRTRHDFTAKEDQAILTYLRQNGLLKFINFRFVWKMMAANNTTTHSAESMRNRFRRFLIHRVADAQDIQRKRGRKKLKRKTIGLAISIASGKSKNVVTSSPKRFCSSRPRRCYNPRGEAGGLDAGSCCVENEVIGQSCCQQDKANNAHDETRLNGKENCDLTIPAVGRSPSDSPQVSTNVTLSSLSAIVSRLLSVSTALTTADQAGILLSMTNGSVVEAEEFLRTGRRHRPQSACAGSTKSPPSGDVIPLWTPEYDRQLASLDEDVLRQLIDKFGEGEVVRRVAYLSA